MTIVDLERTCTLLPKDGEAHREAVSKPLAEYRSAPAYVLLGDPGAGKTTSFRREHLHTPDAVENVIAARDFVTFDVANHPEWRDRTLFIDGLDEIRAGSADGRTSLDNIRARLDVLGTRFRLSCRETDWLGPNDWARLQAVAPSGELNVLRLDALTLDDSRRIAEASRLVTDARQFLQDAKERGLQDLLLNPQTLQLLLKAVGGAGRWPESRLGVFDLACEQLAKETNLEHKFSVRERPNKGELLEDAGRVCALLLLSGTPGVSVLPTGEEDHGDYPHVEDFDLPPNEIAASEAEPRARRRRLALSSRLFATAGGGYPAGQRFEPAHRHIAEFLAGHHLSQLIRAGLPAARVVAMITASDGAVVTAHRGLSGWLAAHSRQARKELIGRDPVGVGLYGDIAGFATREKRALLLSVLSEGRKLQDLHWWNVAAFAPIASQALEAELHEKLTTRPQDDEDQHAVRFLLMLLRDAAPMPALAEPILRILYESSWWSQVSYWALDAFLQHCQDADVRTKKLERLLSDVCHGRLEDPDNRIAGAALERLYPRVVGPAEVWRYLTRTRPSNYFGTHSMFWSRLAEEQRSSNAEVAVLLDTLPKYIPELRAVLDTTRLTAVAAQLLVRGLNTLGSTLTPRRLYDWLSAPVKCGSYADTHEIEEQQAKIASWLESHPDAYKHAFREGLRRGDDNAPPSRVARTTLQRLYEAEPPDDFASWCLKEAEALAGKRPLLARWLFRDVQKRFKQGEHIPQRVLDECVRRHPSWQPEPEDPKAAREFQEAERRWRESQKAWEEKREEEQRQWLDAVRREVPALHENRGAPWLLHRLAAKWFARCSSEPVPLNRWLPEELGPNEDLVAAAFDGLYDAIERPDMPDLAEIVRLHSKSQYHWLSTPFLASLQVRDQEDPTFVRQLTALQQQTALALHLRVPTGPPSRPTWYRHLIKTSPELVASILLPFARTELQRGRYHVAGLGELANDRHQAELARLTSLPLLSGFPVRGRSKQLGDLRRLLWAALQYADRDNLRALIAKKLAARTMTVAQRVTWLTAGLIADSSSYAEPLEEFVGGLEQRAEQLADFFWCEFRRPEDELPPEALEAVIRQLARAGIYKNDVQHSPDPSPGRLGGLINILAAAPEPEAAAILQRLADDESLLEWRPTLLMAHDRQTVVRRDASYKRPELAAIRATLNNAAPANAADLAALALDRLDELAPSIRNSDTNDWRPYWDHDKQGNLAPNDENTCRDALLRQLKPLLPDGVMLPEAAAPGSRRSDIALYCRDLKLPFEAKKQSHRALWRATRDQLVEKYTNDPATDGYGVYLVFWFGDRERTPLDETGTRPGSPGELRQRLEASLAKQLPLEQRRKIAVRVIDVSKP